MLPLTPDVLRSTYDFLRATPPFRSWKLPPGESVKFHVTRHRDREGDHELQNGKHTIRVSSRVIGFTNSLLVVMAHEMVHAYQHARGVKAHHNAEFYRLAARVCRFHGWDPKLFVGPI